MIDGRYTPHFPPTLFKKIVITRMKMKTIPVPISVISAIYAIFSVLVDLRVKITSYPLTFGNIYPLVNGSYDFFCGWRFGRG
jgi:hypothetical protein